MTERRSVTFFLNGALHRVQPQSTIHTVLRYLRDDLHLVGTKEGCAEGDCGACTITEASIDAQGRLQYRPINACIRFLPTLDGKSIWTVEGLNQADGSLHPVQQSMVDHHGSQCGFCTPGFVMSLYTLYAQGVRHPGRQQIVNQLSGNLCRCTGYRPIIDAALNMGLYPQCGPHPDAALDQCRELAELCAVPLVLETSGQTYHAPRTVEQLTGLIEQYPDAVLLAGGTDIGLWVTKQLRELPHIIYIGDVAGLHGIKREAGMIRIEAGVLLDDAYCELTLDYPELSELWYRFASTPIRNSGTFVGNLANGSPIGDTAPALIALGAQVVLRQGAKTRRLVLEDLFVDYGKQARNKGEWIEAVLIPERDPEMRVASYKLSKRFDQDISAVCSAYTLRLDEGVVASVRIVHGGLAATTRRAYHTEAALLGQVWQEPVVRSAMEAMPDDYNPMSDMRATNKYRLKAAQNLLYRFFMETSTDIPTRVHGEDYAPR